jgi:hypothetical protein
MTMTVLLRFCCQVCAPYYAQLVAAAASEVGLCARQHEAMAPFSARAADTKHA